ncbi:MAG: TRAP transporter small permease [Methylocystis sp.]|jgi:TRAP-type C4-dicarboxylate transport system permease small subunit|nr:TRAP transporter small permease [Methylocystis sp.]MCA3583021.1 TRAP transporter small permease [Methylocystis sp.]MCA3587344.1 TRAP transporter small permease [Methylocystis sp.]MCA3590426.1 TRAP transporter small permease [Methylocystis sp.]
MTGSDLPGSTGTGLPEAPASPWLERLTGVVAVTGGLLALAVAILVSVSVLGRWLFNAPIDGDFEFVKMATAVAVFAYLPYTQARRGNIMVDTFTSGLSRANRNRLDAFWDIVYGCMMAYLAYALIIGTLDAMRSGETTMQRQILLWPSIGLSMLLCAFVAATAFIGAWQLLRAPGRNRT